MDLIEGADVKLARMLSAIGIMAALAGCKTCWIDRDDERPMKYGSVRDCLDYGWWGECFHPHYHCGPPDGIRDHVFVKKAAVKAANRALSEQDCGETSRDFRFGFQQAYIDISNGGSGALPAVPPSRYWAGPYRTTWGHNKAREWFTGYEAGVSSAKCCMPGDTMSVPTSVYRDGDNRLAIGLDANSSVTAPMVNANYGWPNGRATNPVSPQVSPLMGGSYLSTRYSSGPAMTNPYFGAMPAPAMPAQPMPSPMMMPAPLPPPAINSVPGGGWSNGSSSFPNPPLAPPSGTVPAYSPPLPTVPVAPNPGVLDDGHSAFFPGGAPTKSAAAPIYRQATLPPPASATGHSAGNPWGQFRGMNGFGFKPEGASR